MSFCEVLFPKNKHPEMIFVTSASGEKLLTFIKQIFQVYVPQKFFALSIHKFHKRTWYKMTTSLIGCTDARDFFLNMFGGTIFARDFNITSKTLVSNFEKNHVVLTTNNCSVMDLQAAIMIKEKTDFKAKLRNIFQDYEELNYEILNMISRKYGVKGGSWMIFGIPKFQNRQKHDADVVKNKFLKEYFTLVQEWLFHKLPHVRKLLFYDDVTMMIKVFNENTEHLRRYNDESFQDYSQDPEVFAVHENLCRLLSQCYRMNYKLNVLSLCKVNKIEKSVKFPLSSYSQFSKMQPIKMLPRIGNTLNPVRWKDQPQQRMANCNGHSC